MTQDSSNPASVVKKTDKHGKIAMTPSEVFTAFIQDNKITCLADDYHSSTAISDESKIPAIESLGKYCEAKKKKGLYVLELPAEFQPWVEKYMKAENEEARTKIWFDMKAALVKVGSEKSEGIMLRVNLRGEKQFREQLDACAKFNLDVMCMDEFGNYEVSGNREKVNSVWAERIADAAKRYDKIVAVGGAWHFSNETGEDVDEMLAKKTAISIPVIFLTADDSEPSFIKKGSHHPGLITNSKMRDKLNITINNNPKHFFTKNREFNNAAEDLLEHYKRLYNTPVEGVEEYSPNMREREKYVRQLLEKSDFACFIEEYEANARAGKMVNGKFIPNAISRRDLAPDLWEDHFYSEGSKTQQFDDALEKFKEVYLGNAAKRSPVPETIPTVIYNLQRADGSYIVRDGVLTNSAIAPTNNGDSPSAQMVLGLTQISGVRGVAVADIERLKQQMIQHQYTLSDEHHKTMSPKALGNMAKFPVTEENKAVTLSPMHTNAVIKNSDSPQKN